MALKKQIKLYSLFLAHYVYFIYIVFVKRDKVKFRNASFLDARQTQSQEALDKMA